MAQQTRNNKFGAGDTIAAALESVVKEVSGGSEGFTESPGYRLTANAAKSSGGSSGSSVLGTVVKTAFGTVPLVGALFSLFGGGDSETTPEFEEYQLPASLNFQGATAGSGISAVDYGQTGSARLYSTTKASNGTDGGATQTSGTAQQITVNVQAMDARSFLDHSSEIAQAVREAMLNNSSLNDVVSEL